MKVRHIVADIATPDTAEAMAFHRDLLMDHGWITTSGSDVSMNVQLSVASEGDSGTAVPDLSIEVNDIASAITRMTEAGIPVEYGPVEESWGVRRFHVRDPFGRLLNILEHR